MAKVITFNSFKGGSGRSLTLANMAYLLSKKYRVGCIDFDMEAPGLHLLFKVNIERNSVQDFLLSETDWKYHYKNEKVNFEIAEKFLSKLVIELSQLSAYKKRFESHEGKLFLIQSALDASTTSLVDSGQTLFAGFANLLEVYKEFLELDYVLVDCRSGISEFSLPGLAFCDVCMVFFRLGSQHRNGTLSMVDWYRKYLRQIGESKRMILVPSSVPNEKSFINELKTYVGELKGQFAKSKSFSSFRVAKELPEDRELFLSDKIISMDGSGMHLLDAYKKLANCIVEE